MFSILILTRNEEQDLGDCLRSAAFSDDVHVFDSCSTDRTQQIARAVGVYLHQRSFDNYAAQRNAALTGIPFKYPWVFILDADERISPGLRDEALLAVAAAPLEVAAFRVRRNDHFLGAWLKHAQIMPFYTRLVRHGRVRYARAVNEVLEVDGGIGDLECAFDHYPFSKGLARWLDKHNQYSTMEARIVAERSYLADACWTTALFGGDFHQRRRAQKAIFYSLPCRPLVRWTYLLFYRRGLLDGYAGLTYATLQAFYEYLIVLKTRELEASLSLKADFASEPPLAELAAGTSVFLPLAEDGTLGGARQRG